MECKFCGKTGFKQIKTHERQCRDNPERTTASGHKGGNQFTTGKVNCHSEETRMKISKKSAIFKHTEETKQRLSKQRSQWLSENPKFRIHNFRPSYMEFCFADWLSKRNVVFSREVHFRNKILNKNYFVDFLFEDKKLIIELDGSQHKLRKELDDERDDYFRTIGYTTIRISHQEFTKMTWVSEIENVLNIMGV